MRPPPTTRPELGEAILRLRALKGLSQNQLSIHTGLDRFTLSRMEKGVAPRLDIVETFARSLGLDINEWRKLAGYPPVENGRDPLEQIREAAARLPPPEPTYEFEWEQARIFGAQGGEKTSAHDLELLKRIHARLLRDKNPNLPRAATESTSHEEGPEGEA